MHKTWIKITAKILKLFRRGRDAPPGKASFEGITVKANLAAHSREFEKRIVQVTDGIHVAIGYGLANSILIEGDDGVIIVDAMESVETAAVVRAEFESITLKPIKALIYTHNHADHVFGAAAFAQEVPVYAHATTSRYIDRVVSVVRPITTTRSMRMFGNFLDAAGLVNAGIGPRLELHADSTMGVIRPTHTFHDTLEQEIAGIRFQLVFAPGETNDQIFVWLPEKKVLLPGDNVYKAFPNLYAIRGTPYRDVCQWVDSLDKMRALRPEHLVPGHSGPISGADEIQAILTDYRDAIQFVHDQTIRGMNRGLTPDELVELVKLPPHLASSPYLQEFYGTVAWSVRAIFDGNLGWFDGNSTHLFPLALEERARRMAQLAGGRQALLDHALQAEASGDHQWALELTDHALRLKPGQAQATAARVRALVALGEAQSNPNARHYYLTRAAELRDGWVSGGQGQASPAIVHTFPMDVFFKNMAVNLDSQASLHLDKRVGFVFPDTGERYTLHVRRGVAEVQPYLMEDLDLSVTVDSRVWKEMLVGLRRPAVTVATKFEVEGSTVELLRLLALFRRDKG